jgi:hypothetical protein
MDILFGKHRELQGKVSSYELSKEYFGKKKELLIHLNTLVV